MARDMGASFNHLYGEHLVLPEAAIEEAVATLPGLDGRKMSKSYDNTIALFAPPQVLRKQIASLVTDSRKPGEPKSTEGSALFQLYQAFASEQETQAMRQAYAEGIAWAQAKEMLFERIDREIAPMRGTYDRLMAQPAQIEEILRAGASKARQLSRPLMTQLRQAVGLRDLGTAAPAAAAAVAKRAAPSIKQYREAGGSFHVKLVDADGATLLQSLGLDSPREAGALAARLRQGDASVLTHPALQPSAPLAAIEQALVSLRIVAETP
jgi:tryptophanyl-tRNA synthetase